MEVLAREDPLPASAKSMERYRPLRIEPQSVQITYADRLLLMGSCFADTIGEQLQAAKFMAESNPMGVVYNPLSLLKLIDVALGDAELQESLYLEQEGLHYHYELHGRCSAERKAALRKKIELGFEALRASLVNCSWLVLTFGSAEVYQLQQSGLLVANCHKQPATLFRRRMLSCEEVVKACNRSLSNLRKLNPGLRTLLTISPVRYGDCYLRNAVSKATLRLAVEALCEQKVVVYFPSYEILLDDLRDYRFYADDLRHPSKWAARYIWQQFGLAFFGKETKALLQRCVQLQQRLAHRPQKPDRSAHLSFLQSTLAEAKRLHPSLPFGAEIAELDARIAEIKEKIR